MNDPFDGLGDFEISEKAAGQWTIRMMKRYAWNYLEFWRYVNSFMRFCGASGIWIKFEAAK